METPDIVLEIREVRQFFLNKIKEKSPEKYQQLLLEFKEEELN